MNEPAPDDDASPDNAERLEDFLTRHGGEGQRPRRAVETAKDVQGWSEVYAADGYTLRCDWSKFGTNEDMKYSEIPPP